MIVVQKLWGWEEILANEPEYCLKRLHLLPGRMCSKHFHKQKKETFVVEQGEFYIETWDAGGVGFKRVIRANDTLLIEPGTPHRFWNATSNSLHCTAHFLEVSTHHSDDDVVRLEGSRYL